MHLLEWANKAAESSIVDPDLFIKHDVKRGLRDISGTGVLAGLTRIGEVIGFTPNTDPPNPVPGRLAYRGIFVGDLVDGFVAEKRFGFEETCYLLLFGELPSADELHMFEERLGNDRVLPKYFVRDAILRNPSPNTMNGLTRSVLGLYVLDENPDDTSIPNVLRQSLKLIAAMPTLAVYACQASAHQFHGRSLFIHRPVPGLSTAENLLYMLRSDNKYTPLEAALLDLTLVLQAEHGGGNNSSFTTHVVSSSGTDTYSSTTASLCSLKGPRHGGANLKVTEMFEDLKLHLTDWESDNQINAYLAKLLDRQAFDGAGLIYGMGHPVYSISDPRTEILRSYAGALAAEKDMQDEYMLYTRVERLASEAIGAKRKVYKGVSANVDFYSGFVYRILDIPSEMFTPLFAVARIVGWCAHRIEEIANGGKIIRPAYRSVAPRREYVPMDERVTNSDT
ncbi:MAG: citrate/2-methylcitrate synthase [Actinomycetota bacterium]|nr:citrate/2-methylcitrate synthase [Actinomycetota bacterium]